jgi:hypothetical protein
MKRAWHVALLICLIAPQFLDAAEGHIELNNDADKISYHFGTQIATNLHLQGAVPDVDKIVAGIKYILENKSPFQTNDINNDINSFMGITFGQMFKSQGFTPNFDVLVQAIKDSVDGNATRFSPEEQQRLSQVFQSY